MDHEFVHTFRARIGWRWTYWVLAWLALALLARESSGWGYGFVITAIMFVFFVTYAERVRVDADHLVIERGAFGLWSRKSYDLSLMHDPRWQPESFADLNWWPNRAIAGKGRRKLAFDYGLYWADPVTFGPARSQDEVEELLAILRERCSGSPHIVRGDRP